MSQRLVLADVRETLCFCVLRQQSRPYACAEVRKCHALAVTYAHFAVACHLKWSLVFSSDLCIMLQYVNAGNMRVLPGNIPVSGR